MVKKRTLEKRFSKKRKGFMLKRNTIDVDLVTSAPIVSPIVANIVTNSSNEPQIPGPSGNVAVATVVRQPSASFINSSNASTKSSSSRIIYKKLVNRSKEKLRNSAFKRKANLIGKTRSQTIVLGQRKEPLLKANGYKLQDAELLNKSIVKAAICRRCRKPKSKIVLKEYSLERCGLAESLSFHCDTCFHETKFNTSKIVNNRYSENLKKPFDINVRSVYASQSIGIGRDGLAKLCATFDLPAPINKNPYNVILKKLVSKSEVQAEQLMIAAAERITNQMLSDFPENVEVKNDGTFITKVAVTVDGTWQRRGHCSKIGIVFVISVLTGEVLDYEIKSLICHECVAHKNDDRSSESFKEWYFIHKDHCFVNHSGSSDSMETEGATAIFLRSIQKRNLKYNTFVGDGDSGCFGAVSEKCRLKYGDDYIVVKEECVGHVQKRMGSGLREYKRKKKGFKLSDNKTVGGRNRLTDKVIDKIQNYYGQAIRNNAGDLNGMKKSISAIFKHMVCNDNETLAKQHDDCPREEGTWCKFWDDQLHGTATYNDHGRLPSAFLTELEPLFTRLSEDKLLKRCLEGHTQNQNEAINGVLWSRCPKTKFCGSQRVKLAVCETVSIFNTGAASKCTLLVDVGVDPGSKMLFALRKEDDHRILNSERKVSIGTRITRRKRRADKKSKTDSDLVTYFPGAFGLSKEPDIDFTAEKAPKYSADKPKMKKIRKLKESEKVLDKFNDAVKIRFIDDCSIPCFIKKVDLQQH